MEYKKLLFNIPVGWDINKCFVKINGEWKIVTDIWTRDDTVTKDKNTNEYWQGYLNKWR